MYITDEQFNKLKTLGKTCANYEGGKDEFFRAGVQHVGQHLLSLLNEIHHEPKVCALCKKEPYGTQESA